jgi:hypothetical protein
MDILSAAIRRPENGALHNRYGGKIEHDDRQSPYWPPLITHQASERRIARGPKGTTTKKTTKSPQATTHKIKKSATQKNNGVTLAEAKSPRPAGSPSKKRRRALKQRHTKGSRPIHGPAQPGLCLSGLEFLSLPPIVINTLGQNPPTRWEFLKKKTKSPQAKAHKGQQGNPRAFSEELCLLA